MCPGFLYVAKPTKQTKKGLAARAIALAKRVREKGKNIAKNKGLRRFVDATLTDSNLMAMVPRGNAIGAAYSKIKQARKGGGSKASPCLKKWFDCVTKPFSQNAQGACIPSGANMDSNRYFGYLRGDCYIGTKGIGFIALSPSPFNDAFQVFVTNSEFATNTASICFGNALAAGVTGLKIPNMRFSASSVVASQSTQIDMPLQARIVGGGVKVYYTGTELNKSGLMSMYTNPGHNCALYTPSIAANAGTQSSSTLGAFQETAIVPVSREPYEYPIFPQLDQELDYYKFQGGSVGQPTAYTHFVYPWSSGQQAQNTVPNVLSAGVVNDTGGNVVVGSCTTLLFFSGIEGQTIHFEIGLHCEAIGDLTEGMRAPADSDPMGVDALMAAMSRFHIERNSFPHMSSADVLKKQYAAVTGMRDMKVTL